MNPEDLTEAEAFKVPIIINNYSTVGHMTSENNTEWKTTLPLSFWPLLSNPISQTNVAKKPHMRCLFHRSRDYKHYSLFWLSFQTGNLPFTFQNIKVPIRQYLMPQKH